jgi:hypothetical protein
MPHVNRDTRERVNIVYSGKGAPQNSAELNYVISTVLRRYLQKDMCYAKINDCLGALEGAKLEMYRLRAVPYENNAIERNGDIYQTTKD